MTRRSGIASLVAAISVVFLAAGFVYLRGGSTPVGVGSAVERFRKQRPIELHEERPATSGPAATSPSSVAAAQPKVVTAVTTNSGVRPLPSEGVYVYATTGGDEVDVLGGSRHQYPAETTVTVRQAGCGLVERWDALEERWDERESCRAADGDTLKRTTSFHEFFGRADKRTMTCNGYTFAAAFGPGSKWSSRCASDNTTVDLDLEAIGWEELEVGGSTVRTLHVRVTGRISGEQVGSLVRDVWGSADSGIVVREKSTLTSYSNQPVFGRTRYHESYENRLKSLEPRK
ncbi:MAG: hypothetical protein ACRDKJ_02025 [Actinomycetota bacterium]